jgi:NAD(P) transhydrogenase
MVGELIKAMQSIGVHFVLGEDLSGVSVQGPQVEAQFTSGAKLATDVLFFAAGRIPNSQKLGLEQIGVGMTNRGHVIVNEDFQTAVPSIYAVGDVIGPPALAATASEQGRHATCHMFGVTTKAFPSIYPIGVYTIPELSSVGKSEEQLIAEKVDYVTGIALYEEIARGNLRGDSHGLLKLLVCRETQAILGIHIVGEGACNLVHIGMAFMLTGGVVQDLVSMIFNYPTLAEGYRIAAFNALNKIFADGSIHEKAAQKTRRSA